MNTRAVSFRFPENTLRRLDRLGRQTRQSRSRLVTDLVEEGLRMDQHPGILFRTGPAGRRPGLTGGPDVWEVVAVFRELPGDLDSAIGKTATLSGLREEQVRAAIGYYGEYKQEIDEWIAENDERAAEAERIWHNQRTTRGAPR